MKYIYILILNIIGFSTTAQYAMFADQAIVSYDKTMYTKNILRKQFLEKATGVQKSQLQAHFAEVPDQIVLKKLLKYKGKETLFEPVRQELDPKIKELLMALVLDLDATTLSNFDTKQYLRYNDMIGQKVIIQDTLKKVSWKITDEYREIAGYNCRRANGITSDSTYVVGYYCNELPIDGGPESINGLPGLILGLVVPSQHVSYFATKVDVVNNLELDKKVFESTKIKRMSRADIAQMMVETFSTFLNKATIDYVVKLALM